MRALGLVIFLATLAGCAQADGSSSPGFVRDGSVTDAAIDAIILDTQRAETPSGDGGPIFPVEDTAVHPCATPKGTTVTASGSYMSTPESVIDGALSSGWNSGGHEGWLRLKFPAPIRFDRVRIGGHAAPPCSEPFTLELFAGGSSKAMVTRATDVPGSTDWYPIFEVPVGEYDELLVDVGTSASWIAIHEVVVFTSIAKCE